LPTTAEAYWRSLYECERARAEAAEARCEELRWKEVDSRSRAGRLKRHFDVCRKKLEAAAGEAKEARRAAKDALSLKAEVARLEKLLAEAGVEPRKRSPLMSLRMEVVRLRKELSGVPSPGEADRVRKALEECRETIRALRKEVGRREKEIARLEERLAREKQKSAAHKETIRELDEEAIGLYRKLRRLRDQAEVVESLSAEVYRLKVSLGAADIAKERLKARLLRVVEAARSMSPSRGDEELRKALGRSRRQKTALRSLSRENARLSRALRRSETRRSRLEAEIGKLRATGAALAKRLFGRKSERQEKPRSERRRGGQPGAQGHGRTPRPALDEKTEVHNPPADARVCACCGQPYVANGARVSSIIEIEVSAHKRVIHRPRWRRGCACASSPVEVSAPPAPRLFAGTPYGTSVWARFLFERYACFRPLRRVAAWLFDQGLPISAGTLGDSAHRFVPLFEPPAGAILARQNESPLRHGDETTWRVQSLREQGRSSRAWLWTSVSTDSVYFHVDPSRSTEVAMKLFGGAGRHTVLVCDRYSVYKKLARIPGGLVTLAWCWSHQRRDYIHCAAGEERLTPWCERWIGRIALLYRLNEARLARYDPGAERQGAAFDVAQAALEKALDDLFAQAERELTALPAQAPEARPLRSLLNHREGLSVFLERPWVPMDNNFAERLLRGPVIGRRLSFGSDSEAGAGFTAMMYSVLGTLSLNGVDPLRWLEAWLTACAENGGRPPGDLSAWLPWSMSAERRRALMAPG
jgi:transposase